jgi:2,5-diamino-6-(ribosylamino)-4(3H)-pyrimidinone 5'-phosphate reductase
VRPRVIVHNAVSVDGRVDLFEADVGVYYELASRWGEDATLVGADTLLAATPNDAAEEPAEPASAAPEPDGRPLLAVVDGRGRVDSWPYLLRAGPWRTGVALCAKATPSGHLASLEALGIERLVAGAERVDLAAALEWLAARHGVRTLRVDSGGTLNGALLRAGLVDEVSVLVHPALVGGTSPRSLYRAGDLRTADGIVSLSLEAVERLAGDLVWLRYRVG